MNTEMLSLLYKAKKPYQYAGGEYLRYTKNFDEADVKLALAFPDKYEIAASNLGHKILYDAVNNEAELLADRVYAPETDFREQLIQNNIPLKTLDTRRNVKDFDIIGFSLQYELAYPTVLEMLRLSQIPVLRLERDESSPIIAAGGPCCFNPAPMSDFIDIFIIGDGEEVIIELMRRFYELKKQGLKRTEIIKGLSDTTGVYAPEFPKKTKKRIFDISKDTRVKKAPVPYCSSVHDRTVIEIRRGCGRMCRFCQAGHVNLPVRERKAADVIKMVQKDTKQAGYNEYSLLSLSSNDYGNIESVIEALNCEMHKKRISVSLPSQRIDRYSTRLAELIKGVRSTTVTLAPEAGSQRLRNVINKNLTEEQIIETISACYKSGAKHIKLYFMAGLPTETYEDIDETAELLRKIIFKSRELKKELGFNDALNITCTLSIFVPKPFTPFQRHAQEAQSSVREKIKYLLDKTKSIKGVKINYHSGFNSKTECALSRGDKKYNKFIYALHKKGVYLSSWDENIDKNLWEETAHECGFDIDSEAQKAFSPDEELPWDIIDAGLDKEWLKEQYKKALNAENMTPCEFKCAECGVCSNLKTHKVLDKPFKAPIPPEEKKEERLPKKFRLTLSKMNEARFISHLDWQNTIIKMLYRSGLDLCFSQGFNPSPVFSLGPALPVFAESICEMIDINIYNDIEETELVKTLNSVLPETIQVMKAEETAGNTPSIDVSACWSLYSFEPSEGVLQNKDLLYIKDKISSSEEIIIEKINKKGIKKLVNIAPSIKSAWVSENKMYLILKTGQSQDLPQARPDDVIKHFCPDAVFRIIRNAFYDENMNRL